MMTHLTQMMPLGKDFPMFLYPYPKPYQPFSSKFDTSIGQYEVSVILLRSSAPYPVPATIPNDIPGTKVPVIALSGEENSPGGRLKRCISMSSISGLISFFWMNTHGYFLSLFLSLLKKSRAGAELISIKLTGVPFAGYCTKVL